MKPVQSIKDYYTNNHFYKDTHSYHYPIWNEKTKTYREASDNTNKVVADALQLKKGDVVLDAGCGVGGTTVWIAERHENVRLTGITIVPYQIPLAQKHAKKCGVDDRVSFQVEDYTKTSFKKQSFSKIYGIESVCYALQKKNFIKEAYRLLKPSGKLAVLDAFVIKKNLTSTDKKVYQDFLDGFVLDNLATKQEFESEMKKAGFKNIRYESQSVGVGKTLVYYYRICTLIYPFVWLLEKLGILKNSLGHIISARNSKYLIDEKVLDYGVFVGTK